jgi:hypothetical protein
MTCVPAKSLLESYLDDELDAAQTAHVAEHLASCSSCAGCMRNFWNCAPASGPTRLITVRPLACASAFRFPCARRIDKPPASRPILALDGDCGRHPAGGFGCMEYRPAPFADFQRGSDRAGRLIEPRAIADGSTPLGRALIRPAHGKAVVQWQAGLLAGRQRLRGSRLSLNWRADRLRGRPSGCGPRVPAA